MCEADERARSDRQIGHDVSADRIAPHSNVGDAGTAAVHSLATTARRGRMRALLTATARTRPRFVSRPLPSLWPCPLLSHPKAPEEQVLQMNRVVSDGSPVAHRRSTTPVSVQRLERMDTDAFATTEVSALSQGRGRGLPKCAHYSHPPTRAAPRCAPAPSEDVLPLVFHHLAGVPGVSMR
jgi:hypothetical protein